MTGALLQIGDVRGRALVEDSCDVAVVGTGPGGATAARVLAGAGLDVVMVEEGPSVPKESFRVDSWSTFRALWRDRSLQVARGRALMPVLQGRAVGGSTPVNGAIVHRMPEPIHDVWMREHGAGELFSWDALSRAWDALDRELSVAPTPEAVFGRNNLLFRDGFRALGADPKPTRRAVLDCEGRGRCNQGCPGGRKQSMDRTFVPFALARGARLYATCRAERLVTDRGRAAGLLGTFRDPETGAAGPRLRVHARRAVVLAASAVQSPLLLLAHGLGRPSRLAGRRFQGHPGTSVLGVFDDPVTLWEGATQGFEAVHRWQEGMKFETVGVPPEVAAARLPGFGADFARAVCDAGHLTSWGVQIRARAHGSVRPGLAARLRGAAGAGPPSIRYGLTPEDVRTMKRGVLHLCEAAFAAGAHEVLPGVHGLPDRARSMDDLAGMAALPDDPRLFHCIVAHLFGTAVFGSSPASSVVSPTLEVWDLPGLHVLDASVFPTNLGVNPQHTIAALAWLAAERLADRSG